MALAFMAEDFSLLYVYIEAVPVYQYVVVADG